jgi:hypothetical protein
MLAIPESTTPVPPRLLELLRTFPCLERIRSLGSLELLVPWAQGRSHGELLAVRFIVSVWNPDTPEEWGLGRFDVHDAMTTWSRAEREAFIAWARAPWWC